MSLVTLCMYMRRPTVLVSIPVSPSMAEYRLSTYIRTRRHKIPYKELYNLHICPQALHVPYFIFSGKIFLLYAGRAQY